LLDHQFSLSSWQTKKYFLKISEPADNRFAIRRAEFHEHSVPTEAAPRPSHSPFLGMLPGSDTTQCHLHVLHQQRRIPVIQSPHHHPPHPFPHRSHVIYPFLMPKPDLACREPLDYLRTTTSS